MRVHYIASRKCTVLHVSQGENEEELRGGGKSVFLKDLQPAGKNASLPT